MTKLLLVEDDNNLREIYEARLQAEGYTIVSAKDGEEALAVAKAEKPDLIISDVMMPKISGFEMLDIIRNTDGLKTVKVIMLTALGQSDDQQRADKLGADRYLVKSQVTLEDIVRVSHDLLGDASESTEAEAPATTSTSSPTAPTPATSPTVAPTPAATPPPAPVVPVTPEPAQVEPAEPIATPETAPTTTAPVSTPTPAAPVIPEPVVAPDPLPTPVTPAATPPPAPVVPVTPEPAQVEPAEPIATPETAPTTTAPVSTPTPAAPVIPEPAMKPEATDDDKTTSTEPAKELETSLPSPSIKATPTETEVKSAEVSESAASSQAQTTSQEEANVEESIENFVAGASSTAPAPLSAPTPAANDTSSITTDENETSGDQATSDSPDRQADDKLMNDAVNNLMDNASKADEVIDTTVIKPTIGTVASSTDSGEPKKSADNDEPSGGLSNNDHVTIAHKKIIAPLEKDKTDINTLYELEQTKEAASSEPAAPKVIVSDDKGTQTAPLAQPPATPTPATNPEPANTTEPPDPNTIAL